jgi:hypothetical protein
MAHHLSLASAVVRFPWLPLVAPRLQAACPGLGVAVSGLRAESGLAVVIARYTVPATMTEAEASAKVQAALDALEAVPVAQYEAEARELYAEQVAEACVKVLKSVQATLNDNLGGELSATETAALREAFEPYTRQLESTVPGLRDFRDLVCEGILGPILASLGYRVGQPGDPGVDTVGMRERGLLYLGERAPSGLNSAERDAWLPVHAEVAVPVGSPPTPSPIALGVVRRVARQAHTHLLAYGLAAPL